MRQPNDRGRCVPMGGGVRRLQWTWPSSALGECPTGRSWRHDKRSSRGGSLRWADGGRGPREVTTIGHRERRTCPKVRRGPERCHAPEPIGRSRHRRCRPTSPGAARGAAFWDARRASQPPPVSAAIMKTATIVFASTIERCRCSTAEAATARSIPRTDRPAQVATDRARRRPSRFGVSDGRRRPAHPLNEAPHIVAAHASAKASSVYSSIVFTCLRAPVRVGP
jgi:hypothetical protein